MGLERKKPKADLKKYYTIFVELGLIASLLGLLGLFNVDIRSNSGPKDMSTKQETVKMEEVVQTEQEEKPPAPPKPQTPVEVPNDEIIEDQGIDLDAELNTNRAATIPPPPDEEEEEDEGEDEVFVMVEHMPKLKGGLEGIQKNIKYPDMARKAGIEGRVYVQFVVTPEGNVDNAEVVRGIGGGCDKEALRVVRNASFRPGMQRGKPVPVRMSLPIVFQLQD